MDLVELLIEQKERNEKYFKDPIGYARIMKTRAKELLGEVKVYLFGSIVRGDYTPASDIDVLIIAKPIEPDRRGTIRAEILKAVGFTSPFEIHLITKETFDNWYKHFIKNELIQID